ncbi:unnamed protein product [Mycena citricolor]|uniref:Uncharacterized protein n=1 Tax=Mycena citricolor TaxID=2018698 RepID=A0AAD2Q4X0_9AGAR|nr:unnamed protein product [Mycena citricolor]
MGQLGSARSRVPVTMVMGLGLRGAFPARDCMTMRFREAFRSAPVSSRFLIPVPGVMGTDMDMSTGIVWEVHGASRVLSVSRLPSLRSKAGPARRPATMRKTTTERTHTPEARVSGNMKKRKSLVSSSISGASEKKRVRRISTRRARLVAGTAWKTSTISIWTWIDMPIRNAPPTRRTLETFLWDCLSPLSIAYMDPLLLLLYGLRLRAEGFERIDE